MKDETIQYCRNCVLDPADEGDVWCLACRMYVEPPLDNDELVRIRVFLNAPRWTAFWMLLRGNSFANRTIRETSGDHDWFTAVKDWFSYKRIAIQKMWGAR